MDPDAKKAFEDLARKVEAVANGLSGLSQTMDGHWKETCRRLDKLAHDLNQEKKESRAGIKKVSEGVTERIDKLSLQMDETVSDLSAAVAKVETRRVLKVEIPAAPSIGLREFLETVDHQGIGRGDSATAPTYDPYPEVFNTR